MGERVLDIVKRFVKLLAFGDNSNIVSPGNLGDLSQNCLLELFLSPLRNLANKLLAF